MRFKAVDIEGRTDFQDNPLVSDHEESVQRHREWLWYGSKVMATLAYYIMPHRTLGIRKAADKLEELQKSSGRLEKLVDVDNLDDAYAELLTAMRLTVELDTLASLRSDG